MGVECRTFLLPRPVGFRPSPEQLASLVDALTAERWISEGAGELRTQLYSDGAPMPAAPDASWFAALPPECVLHWSIDSLAEEALRYPFAIEPEDDMYYAVQLALSEDFVYRTSEQLDPFDDTRCRCGADVSQSFDEDDELFFSQRIARICASCGAAVDPSTWPAVVHDPQSGDERVVPGGATSRFAIVIDCGKCLPSEDEHVPIAPALVATCKRVLGVEFQALEEIY